jgi:hypothetical protein
MSTSEQENLLEKSLNSLGNELFTDIESADVEPQRKIETFGQVMRLSKSHMSVMISFKQMLDYIDKIREPIILKDIKDLLQAYVDMALKYYTQYEASLLKEIENHYKAQRDSERAIQKINALQDPDLLPEIVPLEKFCMDSTVEYEKLLKNFPALLQDAIDKLRDEWQRLGSIAVASQALTEDTELIQLLKAVVDVAAHSIGIDAERIVVVPGKDFALYFFKYLDNLAVLTVPLYSVEAPWEWSIFWHELAGYKVRRLETDRTLNSVREKLEDLHTRYQTSNELEKQKLITTALDNEYSRNYLKQLLSDPELELSDLGGFEHQFERMLINLHGKNKIRMYQRIKDLGWSVDWLKELFEDAWSVLAIGKPFLPFFEDVLRRHSAKDDRHPPLDVRIQVAKELLNLMNPGSLSKEEFQSKIPESVVAEQILRLISLLTAATRKFATDGEDALKLQELRDNLFLGMKEEIQDAISKWSSGFQDPYNQVGPVDPFDQAKKYAEDLKKSFASAEVVTQFFAGFANYNEKNQMKPSYDEMLKDKDYKQLLELSFYDVDFGLPANLIKNIRFGNSIKKVTNKTFSTIASTVKIVLEASCTIKGQGGDNDITYEIDGTTYHAPRETWNQAFKSQTLYQLP